LNSSTKDCYYQASLTPHAIYIIKEKTSMKHVRFLFQFCLIFLFAGIHWDSPENLIFAQTQNFTTDSDDIHYVESPYSTHRIADNGFYQNKPEISTFRSDNSRVLEPHYPKYDHWTNNASPQWTWQVLPQGLIYSSYLAGAKEPRLASEWVNIKNFGWVWDAKLGGRAGVLRYGNQDKVLPEGLQIDIEGAVSLRMNMEHERDMMANDFRVGVPVTLGNRYWQLKTGYYHVSSHMGDEHMITNNNMSSRINYYRDAIVLGLSRRFCRNCRIYAETAYAFYRGTETDPWETQFGFEYAPISPANGFCGTPFFAVDAHLFEELDFSGYLCAQVGWMWRGPSNQAFRLGVQYVNGYDDQYEFHYDNIQKIGVAIWYDF
jgi:hypothetical protein